MLLFVPQGGKTKGRAICTEKRGIPLRWSQYCETFFDVGGRGAALSSCPTPSSFSSSGRAPLSTTWKCSIFEHFSAHLSHLHFSWKSSCWRFGPAWIKSLRWPQESLRYLFHTVSQKDWRCMDKRLFFGHSVCIDDKFRLALFAVLKSYFLKTDQH